MMKIFISVDMEGLAGIHSWSDVNKGGSFKGKILEEQLTWLLEEMVKFDEIEKITVVDSHALGDNIPYSITQIDDRIELISGFPRKRYMMAGLDETYDRVILFGYHAGIGALNATLDHTYSNTTFHNVWINGLRMNEALINSAYAGYLGVPVCMIVGDEALREEISDHLERIVYITTKYALGRFSARFVSKRKLEEEIREGVKKALSWSRDDLRILRFEPPIELKVEVSKTEFADALEMINGVERLDGRTLKFVHDDYAVIFDTLLLMALVGSMMGRLGL